MGCRISVEGRLPPGVCAGKPLVRRAAAFFAGRSAAASGQAFRSVAVVLQDDAGSALVHEAVMGVAGATDVITQRYEAIPPEPAGVYGELYVNARRAVEAAPRRKGWSAAKELLLYVAHGMDHLSGADDHSPRDYARMRRRELGWLSDFLKSAKAFLLAAAMSVSLAASADGGGADWAEYDFERWYADAQGTLLLPQGGAGVRRLGGASAKLGWYAGNFLAVEGAVASLEDKVAFSAGGLWHWWGYERFDPFFTFGAFAMTDGRAGPFAGWGCFWHFDDNWSLRFDAQPVLGFRGGSSMLYVFSFGIQFAW